MSGRAPESCLEKRTSSGGRQFELAPAESRHKEEGMAIKDRVGDGGSEGLPDTLLGGNPWGERETSKIHERKGDRRWRLRLTYGVQQDTPSAGPGQDHLLGFFDIPLTSLTSASAAGQLCSHVGGRRPLARRRRRRRRVRPPAPGPAPARSRPLFSALAPHPLPAVLAERFLQMITRQTVY